MITFAEKITINNLKTKTNEHNRNAASNAATSIAGYVSGIPVTIRTTYRPATGRS
jgi:hypothetical protein